MLTLKNRNGFIVILVSHWNVCRSRIKKSSPSFVVPLVSEETGQVPTTRRNAGRSRRIAERQF